MCYFYLEGCFSMSNIFSKSITSSLDNTELQLLLNFQEGTPELKKQMNKIFQRANRRIQNIQKAGLASPAVKAVIAERGKKDYTYFSSKGLNPTNTTDWDLLRYEYGRALAFLNNPTSSATGARQYIKYQANRLNIPFESANKIVDIATDPTIDEYGNVNIFSYGKILDDFKADVEKIGDEIDTNAVDYAQDLEDYLLNSWNTKRNADGSGLLDRFIDGDND